MPRAMVPPVLQAVAQAVRNRFAGSILDPESRVVPPAQHVVQLEEIDNALPAIAKGIVKYPCSLLHAAAATRQKIGNGFGGQFDHDNGRCLERLDETGRKTDRHAVARPELLAVPRIDVDFSKAQVPRRIASGAEVVLQLLERTLIRHVAAGKYIPHAAAAREPDIPHPARRLCCGHGHRLDRGVIGRIRNLNCPCLVDEKHILFGKKRYAEMLADQERGKSAAIDVEIGGEHLTGFRHYVRNVAGLGGLDSDDLVIHVSNAELLDTVVTEKGPEFAGVQVIGVIRQACEFRGRDLFGRQALSTNSRLKAHAVCKALVARILQPVSGEITFFVADWQRKGMVVSVRLATVRPLHELRPLLERCVTRTEKIRFGYADLFQGGTECWPGAFADANRRLLARFDERD